MSTKQPSKNLPEAILNRASGQMRLPKELLLAGLRLAHLETLETEAQRSNNTVATPNLETLKRLTEAHILSDEKLVPLSKEILTLINVSSLQITSKIETSTSTSISYLWGTTTRAVKASSIDKLNIDFQPMSAGRIPQVITDTIVIRRSEQVGASPLSVSAEILQKAEKLSDLNAITVLTNGGLEENQAIRLLKIRGQNVRRWQIQSKWSAQDGVGSAELTGIDAGEEGLWLKAQTGSEESPGQLVYTPLNQSDLTKAFRNLLPKSWYNRPLTTDLIEDIEF